METLRAMLLVCAVALSGGGVQAENALPRVLILGDQIYQQPAADLKKELKGKAEIHCPRHEPGVVWNTTTALELLDHYLGDGKWDLIHVNCGLGDLIHRVPGMKAFRVMPRHAGGRRATSPEQYEKNLHTLAARLKATGAKIVWGSTTPIRHSSTNVFAKGSEIEYNALAAKVMAKYGVPTNDMYAFVKDLIDMNKPASHGADPFFFDRKPIHAPLQAILRKDLGL
ncbi:MAG: SGNH/GDSL hydrolase family protein [Verrucomicrobia subdivision 3 bacterium]|nr:SGNH/GDSL hydrolase family protein [Limisphaerales bacterium]